MNKNAFCSWSGGKDACLALYKAQEEGYDVRLLFTAFVANGEQSRAHGLKEEVIKAQAKSLGIEIEIGRAGWGEYEGVLTDFIKRSKDKGINFGVFGDIDLEGHKLWIENIAKKTGIEPILPLWQRDRIQVVRDFIGLGFKTIIVSTKTELMSSDFLGRVLDEDLVEELLALGIDPSGEGGEFHSLVVDGPNFERPIHLKIGEVVERDKYHFLQVDIK